MPTLAIQCIAGHYHATPWNKAQNEGAVEWPPSPWRILRALIATGYAKIAGWQEGIMPDAAAVLLEKLASSLPAYHLPEAVGTHTRHYMPADKPRLVLDARAVTGIDHEPLLVRWDVKLEPEERSLLAELAACLSYLGRAESWTECVVLGETPKVSGWVEPCEFGSSTTPGPGWEQIPLMAPVSAQEYVVWRREALDKACAGQKMSAAQRKKLNMLYPANLVACLQATTGWLQAKGWSQPPGSRLVLYWRPPSNTIGVTAPVPAPRPSRKPVPFVLLALATTTRNRSPMPLVVRTLPQAELVHRTIASFVAKAGSAQAVAELLGLDRERKHRTGHQHAHILPLGLLQEDRHLDHILIWAPGGLSDVSQTVLRRIRTTYMKGGVGTLSVRFAGAGSAEDLRTVHALLPIVGAARVWQSRTPFVLPRHRKPRGPNTPDNQVLAELASRRLPVPEKIEWLREVGIAMRHYVRLRRSKAPAENFGYAVRLTFAEPVIGPLCLGYASHFGLGLFTSSASAN